MRKEAESRARVYQVAGVGAAVLQVDEVVPGRRRGGVDHCRGCNPFSEAGSCPPGAGLSTLLGLGSEVVVVEAEAGGGRRRLEGLVVVQQAAVVGRQAAVVVRQAAVVVRQAAVVVRQAVVVRGPSVGRLLAGPWQVPSVAVMAVFVGLPAAVMVDDGGCGDGCGCGGCGGEGLLQGLKVHAGRDGAGRGLAPSMGETRAKAIFVCLGQNEEFVQ